MAQKRPEFPSPANKHAPAFWLEHIAGLLVALAAIGWICLFPDSASRLGRELHYGILLPLAFCVLAAVALRLRGVDSPEWSVPVVGGFFLLQLGGFGFSGPFDKMFGGGFFPFWDPPISLFN